MMLPKVTDDFRNQLKKRYCLLLHGTNVTNTRRKILYTLTAIEKTKREDVPLIGKVCSGKKMCHHDSCN